MESSDLDEIIVYGTKQEKSLQEVPDSINVTTGEAIIDRNILDLEDLLKRIGNADSIQNIRNVQPAVVPSADSGAAPSVAVYLDNARLTGAAVAASGSTGIWDLEQVEVLRGPQSTRQGENTLAGAIVLRTARPTYEFGGRARLIGAEDGQYTASVALGGPILADQLAFRASFDYQTRDGYIAAPTLNTDELDADDQYTSRLALLFEPAGLENFTALFNFGAQIRDSFGSDSLIDIDDDISDREAVQGIVQFGDNQEQIYNLSLELNYAVNDAFKLTSVTTYSDYTFDRIRSNNLGDTVSDQIFTQELRAQFELGPFSGIFGAYTSFQDESFVLISPATNASDGTPIPTSFLLGNFAAQAMLDPAQTAALFALYPPLLPLQIGFAPGLPTNNAIEREKYAVFGEVDWQAADKLMFTFGLRLDHEENQTTGRGGQRIAQSALAQFPMDLSVIGDPAVAAVAGQANFLIPFLFTQSGESTASTSNTVLLPRAGVQYEWTETLTTSFTISRGYRSGGVGITNLGSNIATFEPETLWNYELSLRSLWLDERLRFNVNAFYIDWQDQQIQVTNPLNAFDAPIENAASSHVIGFEIEASLEVADGLNTYATLGYAKGEFDELANPNCTQGDCSGNDFVNAPRFSGAIGGIYKHSSGAFAQADLSYRDDASSTIGNFEGVSPITGAPILNYDSQVIIDAQIGYAFDNDVRVTLFGQNLTDEEAAIFIGAPLVQLRNPRFFGGRVDISF
ncbi:MAG: TonB-dependent receptor [Pseudomonadota bacterium]